MATKKLKMQVLNNLKELLLTIIILVVSVYGGIKVLVNGPGSRTDPENSLSGLLKRLLYWLEDTGHGDIVMGIILVMFGVIVLICLCLTIYHLGYLTPIRSVLGRSILTQASGHETFDDLVHAIDADLAMEEKKFGTELTAGAQWLLSEQVMRISRIERAYVGERKVERKKCSILVVTDGDGNQMKTVFSSVQDRDEAVRYLQNRIPNLYVGDLTDIE